MLTDVWLRLRSLFRRKTVEAELDDELRFHLARQTEKYLQAGLASAEARRRARIELGGLEQTKEQCRDARGVNVLQDAWRDLAYGTRMLRKSPAFAVIAILTLALGIGANLAMLGVLNAWLLEPLPFPHANRIVVALLRNPKRPNEPPTFDAYRDLLAWRHASRSFSSIAGTFWHGYVLVGADSTRTLFGMIVTKDFFSTLQVRPELGRTFRHSDLRGPPVAVLSDSLWRADFGASRSLLGKPITLNGKSYVVIGIMPRSFDFRISNQPKGAQLWTLIQPGTSGYGPNGQAPIAVIGRLRQSARPTEAQAELSVIFRRLEVASPDAMRPYRVSITTLQDLDTRAVRSSLLLGESAVAFLLLIACANLAGLLLARAADREKEMTVRVALGSSRGRLIRQLLAENAIIAVLGTGAGVLVAEALLRLFVAANPLGTLPPRPIAMDGPALIVATALVALAMALVAYPYALQASRCNPVDGLREGSRNSPAGPRATRGRRALVVVEIAIAVVLVTGAALLAQTLRHLLTQPLGFTTDYVTVLNLSLPPSLTTTAAQRDRFFSRLAPVLKSLPGVEGVGISNCSLLYCRETSFQTEGAPPNENSGKAQAAEQVISPGFFASLRIPLVSGRSFARSDERTSLPVAILNQSAARMLGVKNAIGQRIRLGKKGRWRTVVGIVPNTRSVDYSTLGWQTQPRIYVPLAQAYATHSNPVAAEIFVTLRGRGRWTDGELRRAVGSDSNRVSVSVESLNGIIADQFRQSKFRAVFLSCFGLAGLLLAALGFYGVIAQIVSRQTREISIRVALGAQRADILHLVISQGAKLVIAGLAIGVVGALALARLISSLLYGVLPTDPAAFAAVAALLATVALAACYAPARRAMRVDPMSVLRHE